MSSDSLTDQLDQDYAPSWRPEPGETIEGVVTVISERDGGFGSYPIVTVQTADGAEAAVHAFHTVLSARLAELRPRVGEKLAIKYVGKVTGGERPYHSYRIAVDRPAADTIDWSAYGDADAGEPGTAVSGERDAPIDTAGLPKAAGAEGDDVPF